MFVAVCKLIFIVIFVIITLTNMSTYVYEWMERHNRVRDLIAWSFIITGVISLVDILSTKGGL